MSKYFISLLTLGICLCVNVSDAFCFQQDKSQHSRDELQIIKVPVKNTMKKDLFEVFSHVEMIPLETKNRSVLSGISQALILPHRIYIHDNWQKSILWFDPKGNFIGRKDYEGKGPEELTSVFDMKYCPQTDEIYLLGSRILKVFDSDLTFKAQFDLPTFCWDFGIINNNELAFFSKMEPDWLLATYNLTSHEINIIYKRPKNFTSFGGALLSGIYTSGSEQYFCAFYSDTIWSVTGAGFVPTQRIDFGKSSTPWETFIDPSKMDPYQFSLMLDESGKVYGIRDLYQSESTLMFDFSRSDTKYTAVIDRKSAETVFVGKFILTKDIDLNITAHDADESGIYISIAPYDLLTLFKEWQSADLPKSWRELTSMVNKLDIEDNPVLLHLSL